MPSQFHGTFFELAFSTVVLETISFQIEVLSIVIISTWWKLNWFWIWQMCLTYTMIQSTIRNGSFWGSCSFSSKREPMPSHKLFKPSTTSKKQIFDGRIVVLFVKNTWTWSILLRFSWVQCTKSSSKFSSMHFLPLSSRSCLLGLVDLIFSKSFFNSQKFYKTSLSNRKINFPPWH